MYSAYVLSEDSRKILLNLYPPKNERIICHHITVDFGIDDDYTLPPKPLDIRVIGYLSVDGLDAFLVSVDGTSTRSDGSKYHITSSIDPSKHQAKDTNDFITDNKLIQNIVPTISIDALPKILK